MFLKEIIWPQNFVRNWHHVWKQGFRLRISFHFGVISSIDSIWKIKYRKHRLKAFLNFQQCQFCTKVRQLCSFWAQWTLFLSPFPSLSSIKRKKRCSVNSLPNVFDSWRWPVYLFESHLLESYFHRSLCLFYDECDR